MDAISYSHSAKQAKRIKKFINEPDSSSGVVTVPKVIASGETITIPAGRMAVLPNIQIDGTLNVQGDVFIPSGATMSKVVEKVTSTDNAIVRFNGTTGDVQNSGVIVDDSNNVGVNITPSPWTGKAVEVGYAGSAIQSPGTGYMRMSANSYQVSGGNFYYAASSIKSALYEQNQGQHIWYTAPSGTAGNTISWTTAMSLDASGNLSTYNLTLPYSNTDLYGYKQANGTWYGRVVPFSTDGTMLLETQYGGNGGGFRFNVDGAQKMKLNYTGNLLIGTTADNGVDKLQVNGNVLSKRRNNIPVGDTVDLRYITSNASTQLGTIGLGNSSAVIVEIQSTSGNHSFPIYSFGGNGVGYSYNYMNPGTAAWVHSGGISMSFTEAGTSPNTYSFTVSSGSGMATIQATTYNSPYTITITRI